MSAMPEAGPLRDAYIAGATAEAQLREAPRKAAPRDVRDLIDYLEATVEHQPGHGAGDLIADAVYVFASTLTRTDRRRIRRALRGGPR